jgi:hypothetical protein
MDMEARQTIICFELCSGDDVSRQKIINFSTYLLTALRQQTFIF